MKEGPDISYVAALIGDPARANMLTALMSGKALTVSELAGEAGVQVQTASSHLAKLQSGGLVTPRKQGRHKYFAIASDDVAGVLEALMGLAAGTGHLRLRTGPKDDALRKARVCYSHLAGEMGTQLYDTLQIRGYITTRGEDVMLTSAGRSFIEAFGVDLAPLEKKAAPLCRECLDWSERRFHLAGSVGRAVLGQIEEKGWATRDQTTRVVSFTDAGEAQFNAWLAG